MLRYLIAATIMCSTAQLLCPTFAIYNATKKTLDMKQPRGQQYFIEPTTFVLKISDKQTKSTPKGSYGKWLYGFADGTQIADMEFRTNLTWDKKNPVIIIEAESNNPLALKAAYAMEYDDFLKTYPDAIFPRLPSTKMIMPKPVSAEPSDAPAAPPAPWREVSAPAGAGSLITQPAGGSDKGDSKSSGATCH